MRKERADDGVYGLRNPESKEGEAAGGTKTILTGKTGRGKGGEHL